MSYIILPQAEADIEASSSTSVDGAPRSELRRDRRIWDAALR
jgi:hypothetical protein